MGVEQALRLNGLLDAVVVKVGVRGREAAPEVGEMSTTGTDERSAPQGEVGGTQGSGGLEENSHQGVMTQEVTRGETGQQEGGIERGTHGGTHGATPRTGGQWQKGGDDVAVGGTQRAPSGGAGADRGAGAGAAVSAEEGDGDRGAVAATIGGGAARGWAGGSNNDSGCGNGGSSSGGSGVEGDAPDHSGGNNSGGGVGLRV